MARLSTFINEHSDEILDAWEAFAREQPEAENMDVAALRDHVLGMLDSIASDLDKPETEQQREQKARGQRDRVPDGAPTAASRHGLGRAVHGFSVMSTVAEFRALRASVISLWVRHQRQAGPSELEEMRRFNEAIDQNIAESLLEFTDEVEGDRDRFLAVLGHDLRTPLSAIITSSRFLLDEVELPETQKKLIGGIEKSGRRMTQLVNNLLDLALTRFGGSIPIHREKMDLGALVRELAAELVASSSATRIEVKIHGALEGEWDRTRLAQAVTNLVTNAIEHGTPARPIKVTAVGEDDEPVVICVMNEGSAIPAGQIQDLFGPMKGAEDRGDRRHLGLGLYIVDQIVEAHGGQIDVRSSDEQGTMFRITIPRHATPEAKRAAKERPMPRLRSA